MVPHDFIGLAEETGLIVGLGLRVLSTACEHGRRWEEQFGADAPRIHVNLSARQLTTSNLPILVQGVLDGSGLTPAKLCLEITESVLMDDASGGDRHALGAQGHRGDAGHRRLRHRLLVAQLPAPLPRRRASRSTSRSWPGSVPIPRTRPSSPPSSTWPTRSSSRPSPRASRPSTSSSACGASAATWPRGTTSPSPPSRTHVGEMLGHWLHRVSQATAGETAGPGGEQRGVVALVGDEVGVGARPRPAARPTPRPPGRRARRSTGGGRSRRPCGPA